VLGTEGEWNERGRRVLSLFELGEGGKFKEKSFAIN
jgi:hypothetical protein